MHVGWGQAYALPFGKWIEDPHRPVFSWSFPSKQNVNLYYANDLNAQSLKYP